MMHYFAADGSYGEAEGLVIIETSLFDAADWLDLEGSLDVERAKEAVSIAALHESPMAHMDHLASTRQFQPREPGPRKILIQGNPVDGFIFIGPFPASADPASVGDEFANEVDWWVADLQSLQEYADDFKEEVET